MAFRLSARARRDLDKVLKCSLEKHGRDTAGRYQMLLKTAMQDVGNQPLRNGSRPVRARKGQAWSPVLLNLAQSVVPAARPARAQSGASVSLPAWRRRSRRDSSHHRRQLSSSAGCSSAVAMGFFVKGAGELVFAWRRGARAPAGAHGGCVDLPYPFQSDPLDSFQYGDGARRVRCPGWPSALMFGQARSLEQ